MFRIGEFSTIAQVSGRQLRYYDQLGLLEPVRIDPETGYRYYSAGQLPRLNRILALKELGLTLDQIGRFLDDDVSAEEIRGMLKMKKEEIEQAMRDALAHFRYIESRISQIENRGALHDYDVVVKSIPAQRYLALRTTVSPQLGEARQLLLEMQRVLPEHVGSRALGLGTIILHADVWEDEAVDMEIGFILNSEKDYRIKITGEHVMAVRELPAIEKVATTLHVGLPREVHRSYSEIARWAETNGYRFAGPGRKVFIHLPEPGNELQTVAEVQFPLERLVLETPMQTKLKANRRKF